MGTTTGLSRSLLVVALLAVSWAAAAPLQSDPEDGTSEDMLVAYFERHPDAARDLFPELLNKATSIDLTLEDDVVADLIQKNTAQEDHRRHKRNMHFNFANATFGSHFNFRDAGIINDSSRKHSTSIDSSRKDYSKHDSSHKDYSKHDSSHKDYSKHYKSLFG